MTTTHAGEVIVDVRSAERANQLTVTAALPGRRCALDARLWIEGNLSVDYGGRLMADLGALRADLRPG